MLMYLIVSSVAVCTGRLVQISVLLRYTRQQGSRGLFYGSPSSEGEKMDNRFPYRYKPGGGPYVPGTRLRYQVPGSHS